MSFTGDISKLGRIGADVASLADVPRVAADIASERIEALVQFEFDAGVDPYGDPWAPLAEATIRMGRHEPPLTGTRELRDSLLVYPTAAGLRATIGTDAHPAGPHQDGWPNGPARPILPTGDMPLEWAEVIEDATIEAVTEKLREART